MPKSSIDRVAEAAAAAGLEIEIVRTEGTARTAQEAAAACGCAVGQIVKSLIFADAERGDLVLLLIAGDRQADIAAASAAIGGRLERVDAKRVRAETGFAIGGVAPIGHIAPVREFIDPSLLDHEVVWAAAGAPDAVFAVDPKRLREAVGATVLPADAAG